MHDLRRGLTCHTLLGPPFPNPPFHGTPACRIRATLPFVGRGRGGGDLRSHQRYPLRSRPVGRGVRPGNGPQGAFVIRPHPNRPVTGGSVIISDSGRSHQRLASSLAMVAVSKRSRRVRAGTPATSA